MKPTFKAGGLCAPFYERLPAPARRAFWRWQEGFRRIPLSKTEEVFSILYIRGFFTTGK